MSWYWLRDEIVICRKNDLCLLCGESILKGEKYVKRTGTDDGIITMKMHQECEKVTKDWELEDWETFDRYNLERPTRTEER